MPHIRWIGGVLSGRDCPIPPISVLPPCVLASERAEEKQSPERISLVLTVDDPHGSCMLKLGRAGPANLKPGGMKNIRGSGIYS